MILTDGSNRPIAPQAYGETSPQFYQGVFVGQQGLELETRFATYANLYRKQPWVAACVNKIANLIARLGINVWDETNPERKILDTTGPYASLLAAPCERMDPYSFWLWVAATIEIYGETYLIKVRGGPSNKPVSFLPMHPAMTQIHRDDKGRLVYRFMGQPNELLDQDDVVPFKQFNPDGYMRGHSRLESLRSTLMNEDSSRRAQSSWWKNSGRPSVVLHTDKILGPEGRERVRAAFDSQHGGSANAGKVAVFEDGITATTIQMTAAELQYIESRKLNREEVASVFDIPATAVGINDHATYSNITEQMRSVYRDSMAPRIEFIESVLNHYVGSEFNGPKTARFAVAEVLRGDFETRAASCKSLVETGIMMPAEARPLFDLGDAGPVADKLYAQAQLQELGRPAERITIAAQESPGVTPSGIPVGATPVPALNGGAPTVIPAPKQPLPLKYVRCISGAMARGKTLEEAALHFRDINPDDNDAIYEACVLIMERNTA